MLTELTETTQKRITEYKKRKPRYAQMIFRFDEEEHARSTGWELVKTNKHSLRFQRLKPLDEQFENEVWCLFYELGYPSLNVGRNFQIEITQSKGKAVSKQIDVFCYDSETIIVAECKCSEVRVKKSLQKDIGEFASNQRAIANTLRKSFGGKFPQKVIWLFATKNIEWSDNDLARAKEANIHVITERELFYYKEIAKRIGRSARYQFHAEFLQRSKVAALENIEVFAIKTKLGPFRAFTFFAPATKILPIAFVNHRDLRDPESAPTYQRLIHRGRLKQIAEFLENGGFFPNSIILNFKQKPRYDPLKPEDRDGISAGVLTLPNAYKSAWIIDGQHRLYGYTEIDENDTSTLLPFLAFENIPVLDETRIFSDINSKQKSVSRKLLDELTGEIKLESPNKREQMRAIAARVFDFMRDDDDGPLGNKIAGAELKHTDLSILTIPFLVEATLQSRLLGDVVLKEGNSTFIQGYVYWDDPHEAITSMVDLLKNYFELFRKANQARWDSGRVGKFGTNVGAAALIRLLGDVIAFMARKEGEEAITLHPKIVVERIEKYLEPCLAFFRDTPDSELERRFHVPFGSGGPRVFQHRLRELVALRYSDFDAPGFAEDLRKYDAERTRRADQMIREIQESIPRFVLNKLREIYKGDDFLEKAVDNKEILKRTYEKRLEADEKDRKDMGTYLEFLDFRKIVEAPKNWSHFSDQFNIHMPDEKKNRTKCVGWLDEINKLRRVPAHPYNRGYTDDEIGKLQHIYDALHKRGILQVDYLRAKAS